MIWRLLRKKQIQTGGYVQIILREKEKQNFSFYKSMAKEKEYGKI